LLLTISFLNTESKIFRGFEDNHLPKIMENLDAKSANDLKIEVDYKLF